MKEAVYNGSRRGPIVELDPQILHENRHRWSKCLIGYLLDERSFFAIRVQPILQQAWQLQREFHVIGTQGQFYIVQFDTEEDRAYVHANRPCVVQGALLVFVHWRPNIILREFHITSLPIWVQIQHYPFEYQTFDFIGCLGSIFGLIDQIDRPTSSLRNLRFASLQVGIRPHAPLFMGFMLKLDDGNYRWIQCKYERVFRICYSYGKIGHKANTCNWTN